MSNQPQVEPQHYHDGYDTRERFISYWHQADQILRRAPKNVLEVGIGSGFLHRYLRTRGVDVHTLDFDARLEPDTVGSVLALPFADAEFELVCCYETLEHLPWENFAQAVAELSRVARRWVLVSVPDVTPCVRVDLARNDRPWAHGLRDLPNLRPKAHVFDGQHYWEIGKRGFPRRRIEAALTEAGLELEERFRVFELPYHHYFACAVGLRKRALKTP
jgi:2-polyprenyl-3-methyl-5-hydroxy-6-metoxy-1,4-benzoquinol methylase